MNAPAKALAEPQIKVRDVITLTARLAQLLAEEVDLLTAMKVSKIEALQQEKLFLISALDAHRKQVDKYPHLRDTIAPQDKRDLQDIMKVFNDILAENHRKLLLAKEVNYKVVQAVTKVVKQNTLSRVYNGRGSTGYAPYETLSVTLNKSI